MFVLFSSLTDIGMKLSGYMIFHGWNLFYSVIVFFVTYAFLLPIHIRFIKSNE
ncbi:hypothetical protein [Niallia sp. 03133]|uniref:hypothetical protein n=1 Tax=Niallia sp. 03133 TaxID=3458060 RepID=UPI004044B69A